MSESIEGTPYLRAVAKVFDRFSARRRMSPAQLLTYWSQFVEAALGGYRAGWYDFDNERRVRDVIQAILDDPAVGNFPEAQEWGQAVREIDDRCRPILTPMSGEPPNLPWWLAGAPRYAGSELASDLRRMYNTEVETRE